MPPAAAASPEELVRLLDEYLTERKAAQIVPSWP
jgi:hypothetical protein